MNIRMLETRRGTPDGFTLRQYHAGKAYDLPEVLACSFLNAGYAELAKDQLAAESIIPTVLSFAEQKAQLRDRLGITQRNEEAGQ